MYIIYIALKNLFIHRHRNLIICLFLFVSSFIMIFTITMTSVYVRIGEYLLSDNIASLAEAIDYLNLIDSRLMVFEALANIVSLITIFVTLFVAAIIIHEIRFEIGVLLSMGMSKARLIFAFTFEILIIIILSTTIGLSFVYLFGDWFLSLLDFELLSFNELYNIQNTLSLNLVAKNLYAIYFLGISSSLVYSLCVLLYSPLQIITNRK